MQKVIRYIKDYSTTLNKKIFFISLAVTGFLVFLNYRFRPAALFLPGPHSVLKDLAYHFVLFLFAFLFVYVLYRVILKENCFKEPGFLFLSSMAALLFAIKVNTTLPVDFFRGPAGASYWDAVLYWPIRLLLIALMLFFLRDKNDRSFYGLFRKAPDIRIYFLMLLIMIPLILFASTRPDFLATYPKMKIIEPFIMSSGHHWIYRLIFELSYGTDFISIELFFRGFLIFSFSRYAGKNAILPMACFYCTIHFGKPLFECISSFWGGLLLGIISYNTRSVTGGLIVHLGLAWMMEWGGWLGNHFFDK